MFRWDDGVVWWFGEWMDGWAGGGLNVLGAEGRDVVVPVVVGGSNVGRIRIP